MTRLVDFGFWSLETIEELNEKGPPEPRDLSTTYIPRFQPLLQTKTPSLPKSLSGLKGKVTFGEEVVNIFKEEQCIAWEDEKERIWKNRLGLLYMKNNQSMMIRPRQVIKTRVKADYTTGNTFAVEVLPWEREKNQVGKPLGQIPIKHPVQQIASNRNGNGVALREDYQTTLLWSDINEGKIIVSERFQSPYTKFAIVNPYERSAVVMCDDQNDGLFFLNENAQCTRHLERVSFSCATFSLTPNVLFGFTEGQQEGADQLTFVDRRTSRGITLQCPSTRMNCMTWCTAEGLFAAWNEQQGLNIFDLRQLSLPFLRIAPRYMEIMGKVTHLQWMGSEEKGILAFDDSFGYMVTIADINMPRPLINQVAMDHSVTGIIGTLDDLFLLSKDLQITHRTWEELNTDNLISINVQGPSKRKIDLPQIKIPLRNLIGNAFDNLSKTVSNVPELVPWNTVRPHPADPIDIDSFPSICKHLNELWAIP